MTSWNDLLSTREVAEKLGISKNTLYSWVRDRKTPHIRLGQDFKFDPADLQAWLAARKQPAAP